MPEQLSTYTETVSRKDPFTEAATRGLFESAQDVAFGRMGFRRVPKIDPTTGQPMVDAGGNTIYDVQRAPRLDESGQPMFDEQGNPLYAGPQYSPTYQVAAMDPQQIQAEQRLQQGLGAYLPYIEDATGNLQGALSQYGLGQEMIQGGTQAFDPSTGIAPYMNPYEDQVVQQVQRDFDRVRKQQAIGDRSQAIGAGAFGGSRSALAESEGQRNLYEAELDALAQLRSSGYKGALDAASQAFENQQRRALTGGSYLGNLGQGIGNLARQQADLGTTLSGQQRNDILDLTRMGGYRQAYEQDILDATRQTDVERQNLPYQQLSYLSDILSGVPSGSSTMTSNFGSSPSAAQQALGYGIATLSGLYSGVA